MCSCRSLIPSLVAVLILRTADTLKLFDMPFTMTRGGPGSATEFIAVLIERVWQTGSSTSAWRQRSRSSSWRSPSPWRGFTSNSSTARSADMAAPVQRRSLWGEGALLLLIGLFCVFPFY